MKGGEDMEKTKLEMEFLDEAEKKFTIRVDNPRIDLTEGEVSTAMNDIITNNVFVSGALDLKTANDARIITTTIDTLNI